MFLHRNNSKRVDPNRLNGVGGRVEPGEDYLSAAIRETEEETGYRVSQEDIQLAGVVRLEGGYQEDWIMCFFKITIKDKKIPKGAETDDGRLMWINKAKVLNTEFELVDDVNYCFKEIVEGKELFFMTAQLDQNQKVKNVSINKLSK